MINEVIRDNGKGGTSSSNNREYGGFIENGRVEVVKPGDIANPQNDAMATIELPNGVSTFHSHPSGTIAENGSGNILEESRVHFFEQSPSKLDIENAEGFTHYVFGRGNNTVYIYNSQGVQAVISMKRFKNLNN